MNRNRDIKSIVWLAGYLEGEGSFSSADNRGARVFKIQVGSTDEDVMRRVCNIIYSEYKNLHRHGHGIRNGYARKEMKSANVQGALAIGWMMTIYSLMGTRRKARIREIINEWKLYEGRKFSGKPYYLRPNRIMRMPKSR